MPATPRGAYYQRRWAIGRDRSASNIAERNLKHNLWSWGQGGWGPESPSSMNKDRVLRNILNPRDMDRPPHFV